MAIHNARPDFGTKEIAGNNTISSNGRYDINNATGSNTLVAVGNNINAEHISGKLDHRVMPSDSQMRPKYQSVPDTGI